MNRYYKLQNGDIFDNQTRTTISRNRLLDILNLDSKPTVDLTGDITFKKAMEMYDELARDENSVLD